MKLSVSRTMNHAPTSEPPIPFERPITETKGKHLAQTFKCRLTPADAGLTAYKVTVPYFSHGMPEIWIQSQKSLKRVFAGQGDTTGTNKYTKLRQLLQGEAAAALETHVLSVLNHTETNATYVLTLNAVLEYVFPRNATKMQKRFLRLYLWKLEEVSTR